MKSEQDLGHNINPHQDTWIKLQQMKDEGFNWDTIMAWKSTYAKAKNVADFQRFKEDSDE